MFSRELSSSILSCQKNICFKIHYRDILLKHRKPSCRERILIKKQDLPWYVSYFYCKRLLKTNRDSMQNSCLCLKVLICQKKQIQTRLRSFYFSLLNFRSSSSNFLSAISNLSLHLSGGFHAIAGTVTQNKRNWCKKKVSTYPLATGDRN